MHQPHAATAARTPIRPKSLWLLAALGLGIAACTRDVPKSDTTATPGAAAATRAPAAAADTTAKAGMAGMAMTGDADHDFLRQMSDHHKGLIAMVHQTVESKDKLATKPIADRLDKEQDAELDQMMSMLEKDYKDPYAPKIMPEHQAMVDELKGKTAADYDKTFLADVVKHHEEALKMIDDYLPKAKSPAVKSMAEKMKAVQAKEIAEYKAKLSK